MNYRGLLAFVILLVCSSAALFAQAEPDVMLGGTRTTLPDYKLRYGFYVNKFTNYTITDSTKFVRYLNDKDSVVITRNATYYVHFEAPALPENGFQLFKIVYDSLKYEYNDQQKTTSFYSQDEETVPPTNIHDYIVYGGMLGRTIELTYSPYYEVAKIGGDHLEELRYHINDPEVGIRDTMLLFLWRQGASDQMIKYMADLNKGLIPDGRVVVDSSWRKPMEIMVNGVLFADTTNIKLVGFDTKNFHLASEFNAAKPSSSMFYLNGVKTIVPLESGNCVGKYDVWVNPKGIVTTAEGKYISTLRYKLKDKPVKEVITTKIKTELDVIYSLD